MSGGGGSYTSGPSIVCDCETLVFTAVVQSPVATAISQLVVGDKLTVNMQGPQGPITVTHAKYGNAGTIVNRVVDLLRCIEDGNTYEATVTRISGFQVTVEIRPV